MRQLWLGPKAIAVRFVLLVYENNVALHCSVQDASKKEEIVRAPDLEFRHQSQAWLTQSPFAALM